MMLKIKNLLNIPNVSLCLLNYTLNVSLLSCHIVILCSSKTKTQKACEILGNNFLTYFL